MLLSAAVRFFLTFSLDELRLSLLLLLLSSFLFGLCGSRQQRIHQYQQEDEIEEDARPREAGRQHHDITNMPREPRQCCSQVFYFERSQCFVANNPDYFF